MTAQTLTSGLSPEQLAAVLGERTRVAAALDAAFRWSDRGILLEQSAVRVAQLLKTELDWPTDAPAAETSDQATIAFVEQWIVDVASMTDDMVAAVRAPLGDDGLMDFIHSLLTVEQRIRLELAWQHLGLLPAIGAADGLPLTHWGIERGASIAERDPVDVALCAGRIAPGRHGDQRLTAALSEWQAAVVCLGDVDPVTTELVRLRCANYHDCHT